MRLGATIVTQSCFLLLIWKQGKSYNSLARNTLDGFLLRPESGSGDAMGPFPLTPSMSQSHRRFEIQIDVLQ